MKAPPRTSSRTLYGLTIVVLLAAVTILVQFLERIEGEVTGTVQSLQRVLASESLLRTPSDPHVRFGPIEDLLQRYGQHPYLKEMTVTKVFGTREDVIYPFYWPALRAAHVATTASMLAYPDPARPAPDVLHVPLVARGVLLGHLYVRIDRSAVRTVQGIIIAFIGLLAAFVGVFVAQFRRQEAVISQTTIELEEKRRELVRLERLALAGQLSANLLHDLKKPVLNIKNELRDLLAGAQEVPPDLRERLALLEEQTSLFFSMLRESNLERFVRGEGDREYVDIHDVLRTSLALVRYERGQVRHECAFGTDVPPLLAQPVLLVQVFSNLILNAYQAMQGRGTLFLRTRSENGQIIVEVADTGPGIRTDQLEKIFTPFYSTKPADQGTGLGLYISRDIVRQLGGEISVTSTDDGTCFRVVVPVA